MSTDDLQKTVYDALVAAPGLSEVGVTKYYADYNGSYPFLVYKEISNVPALHADNVEVAARVTYQISIVTADDEYTAIENEVKKVMSDLGFLRVDSTEIKEDEDYIRVLRFCAAQVQKV